MSPVVLPRVQSVPVGLSSSAWQPMPVSSVGRWWRATHPGWSYCPTHTPPPGTKMQTYEQKILDSLWGWVKTKKHGCVAKGKTAISRPGWSDPQIGRPPDTSGAGSICQLPSLPGTSRCAEESLRWCGSSWGQKTACPGLHHLIYRDKYIEIETEDKAIHRTYCTLTGVVATRWETTLEMWSCLSDSPLHYTKIDLSLSICKWCIFGRIYLVRFNYDSTCREQWKPDSFDDAELLLEEIFPEPRGRSSFLVIRD